MLVVTAGLLGWAGAAVATAADTHSRTPWCAARQLTLSNSTAAHSREGSMQTSVWALQLRNAESTACRIGGWLRFSSVRDPRGRPMHAEFRYGFAAYGHTTRPFLLRPGGRAFAQMAQPILHSPHAGCAARAELTFEAPHDGGRLAVSMPERHVVCPHVWIAVSPIQSSEAFYTAMEQLSQSGGMHLPYSRSERGSWVRRDAPARLYRQLRSAASSMSCVGTGLAASDLVRFRDKRVGLSMRCFTRAPGPPSAAAAARFGVRSRGKASGVPTRNPA